ncbi:MAG TPA: tol-pal system protein YbgF, partial [Caulobacter sp.]|nr:tol-pal system protein YbgF [Caulobacter sp.]
MTLKSILLAALLASTALPALAQTPLPQDPLDDRSVRRVERMEKVVRELRSIVFQGRDTGKPVVVQPAETEAQILTLGERITDLEQTLQKVNGQNEVLTHDLDQARRDSTEQKGRAEALEARLAALEAKLTTMETAAVQVAAETPAPPAPPADPAVAFKQARQFLLDGD